MPQKNKANQTKFIIEAALSHADKVGWDGLTLDDIAKKAKVPRKAVEEKFSTPWRMLPAVLKKLDMETEKAVEGQLGGPWRDNLFEVLMSRFDLLEKHRRAYTSILPALMLHPRGAARCARPFLGGMHHMLTLAKAPAGPPQVAVFAALYLSLVDVWKKDETPDLAKTMAAVDKRLGIFERVSDIPSPSCGRGSKKH